MAKRKASSNKLLDHAYDCVLELRQYLKGEIDLSKEDIEASKAVIRAASRRSFYFFAKAVLKFDKMVENPHLRWCQDLERKFWERDYLMRLKPRECYKTTIYGEAFILWVWATISPKLRFFYTSANATLLEEISTHLDYYIGFDSQSVYSLVFGIKRDRLARYNTANTINIVGRDKATKGSSLTLRTAGGSVAGVHPHIIIVDDPMDKEDRESPAIRRKKERWYESLIPLLSGFDHPKGRIAKLMFIATRWHIDDLVSYVLRRDDKILDPLKKYDVEVEAVEGPDGPMYGDFFPQSRIDDIKSRISTVFYACQYLNNPIPEGARVFEAKKMHFITMDQAGMVERDGILQFTGRNWCFFDPSKGKEKSDYPAVVWPNQDGRRIFFFHAIDDKHPLATMVQLIALANKRFRVSQMVFEGNGSSLLKEALEKEHQKIGHPIVVTEITHHTNKHERIVAAQPELYNGTVFFRADYKQAYPEMMNQILLYPAAANDDFPDVVEMSVDYIRDQGSFEFVRIGGDGRIDNNKRQAESAVAQAFDRLRTT